MEERRIRISLNSGNVLDFSKIMGARFKDGTLAIYCDKELTYYFNINEEAVIYSNTWTKSKWADKTIPEYSYSRKGEIIELKFNK